MAVAAFTPSHAVTCLTNEGNIQSYNRGNPAETPGRFATWIGRLAQSISWTARFLQPVGERESRSDFWICTPNNHFFFLVAPVGWWFQIFTDIKKRCLIKDPLTKMLVEANIHQQKHLFKPTSINKNACLSQHPLKRLVVWSSGFDFS